MSPGRIYSITIYTSFGQSPFVQLSRRTYVVIVIVIVAALAGYFGLVLNSRPSSQPEVLSNVLSDPTADVGNNPVFFDVVSARVVRSGANLSFSATVAGEIPQSPTGVVAFGWFITSGVTSIDRPVIVLIFDPSVGHWVASVFEGRPPSASTTDLSFTMEGNVVTVSVSLDTLGNPQNLTWHIVTRSRPFGIMIPLIDRAPDSGEAPWPAP